MAEIEGVKLYQFIPKYKILCHYSFLRYTLTSVGGNNIYTDWLKKNSYIIFYILIQWASVLNVVICERMFVVFLSIQVICYEEIRL